MLPDSEIVYQLSTRSVVRAVPDMVAMAAAIGGARADNTTALAIMWQGADDVASSDESVISTQMLPADQVSSTIDATPAAELDPAADVFDEDEIEKAIAEIREAIEKSSQLLK
jgi:protein phosphatase